MAKRRRLTPVDPIPDPRPAGGDPAGGETMTLPIGLSPLSPAFQPGSDLPFPQASRAPVASVAADSAAHAALQRVSAELADARRNGRLIVELPLDAIDAGHLTRDRLAQDPEEMAALKASIAERGQQVPIEVVARNPPGQYGLISGARRLAALRALHAESGYRDFATVRALVRRIDTAQAAYLAMIEENEIRANLSFYERGRMVAEAVRLGLYPSQPQAVRGLFARASASRRSKILDFAVLHAAIGPVLRFGPAIPEKLGLALARALEADPGLAARLADRLRKADCANGTAERLLLERALRHPVDEPAPARGRAAAPPAPAAAEAAAGMAAGMAGEPAAEAAVPRIQIEARPGRVVLTGKGVTLTLTRELEAWLERWQAARTAAAEDDPAG